MKKNENRRFGANDNVRWNSGESEKRGRVIAVVPAFANPANYIPASHQEAARLGTGAPRDHESYLVLLRGTNRIEWPRVALLRGCPGRKLGSKNRERVAA